MSKKATAQPSTKAGWRIDEWLRDTGIQSRTTVYALANRGLIEMVKIGRKRLITTSPSEFIARVRHAEQRKTVASRAGASASLAASPQ